MSVEFNTDFGEDNEHCPLRTTRWKLIHQSLNAPDSEESRRQALDQLCRIYWPVVRQYVLAHSNYRKDADDLTQEFFALILSNGFLKNIVPNQGLFRSWLLVALKNFLTGDRKARHALKRGEGLRAWSFDQWQGGEPRTLSWRQRARTAGRRKKSMMPAGR